MEKPEFLAAVVQDPGNDTPRLVYADWLDERGDPRGEFIRIQCQLAKLGPGGIRPQLAKREKALLEQYRDAWVEELPVPIKRVHFRRGFAETVEVRVRDFLADGSKLLDQSPTLDVHLSGSLRGIVDKVADCKHLGRLRSLALDNCNLQDGAFQLAASPHLTKLENLRITNANLKPSGAEALFRMNLPQLRSLNLSNNQLNEGALAVLGENYGPQLHDLQIKGAKLEGDDCHAWVAGMGHAALRTLNCSYNRETEREMGIALSQNGILNSIQKLNIGSCRIGNEGLAALTALDLPELRSITLSGSSLDDEALDLLLAAPWFQQLSHISLSYNVDFTSSRLSQFLDSPLVKRQQIRLRLLPYRYDESIRPMIENHPKRNLVEAYFD